MKTLVHTDCNQPGKFCLLHWCHIEGYTKDCHLFWVWVFDLKNKLLYHGMTHHYEESPSKGRNIYIYIHVHIYIYMCLGHFSFNASQTMKLWEEILALHWSLDSDNLEQKMVRRLADFIKPISPSRIQIMKFRYTWHTTYEVDTWK